MICNNCGKENKNTNIRCYYCGEQLINPETFQKEQFNNQVILDEEQTKTFSWTIRIVLIIVLGPIFLFGLVLFSISLFSGISEELKIIRYDKMSAKLKDVNCEYTVDTEWCEAVYEYEVDGKTYTVSPNTLKDAEGFKKKEFVYYNPNEPQESIIRDDWMPIMIIGAIIIYITGSLFVKTFMIPKRIELKPNKKTKFYL